MAEARQNGGRHLRPARSSAWAAATALCLAALAGCANDRGPHPELPYMGVNGRITSKNMCGLGVSPELRLGIVPAGTSQYRVRITNVSALSAPRIDTALAATGATIPEGAIADYDGPCVGERQVATYRVEVMAMAQDGRPLAFGWQFLSARSLTRQVEDEQRLAKRPPEERQQTTRPDTRPYFFIQ